MLITKNPINIAAGIVLIQFCAFFVPLFNFLSSSVIALLGFHYRSRRAYGYVLLLAITAAAIVLGLLTALGMPETTDFPDTLMFALLYWIPPAVLAYIWKRTSLSLVMQLIGVSAIAAVLIAHWQVEDLPQMWRELIYGNIVPMEGQSGHMTSELLAQIDRMTGDMTGLFTASLVMSYMLCLLFGRWMHVLIKHPGEFRDEVLQGRMGMILAAVMAGVIVAQALDYDGIWRDTGFALAPLFLLQGVMTVHRIVLETLRNAKVGLVIFYITVAVSVLLAQMLVLLLIVLGVLENFLHLRRRVIEYSEQKARETNST